MENKIYITKKEIDKLIVQLAEKIKKSGKEYDYIVGIARGGLNISKPLAKLLKTKHISIRVSFYGKIGIVFPYPRLIDTTALEKVDGSDLLFVDDLIDAGHTINWINKNLDPHYGPFDIAVLHLNKNNQYKITPTFYVKEKPNSWLVYPWEQKET
jgi:hypoxanthine phosphoribosyltransferase